jgi:coenzyme F420-0:L-glutamate ligase/coenzyme F420-1:gamma-L-glutamate ligase
MKFYAIKTKEIAAGDNVVQVALDALRKQKLLLEDNDILAFTSKIVAHAEGRVMKLEEVKPSDRARKLARKFSLQPQFAELILREADKIYGGVEKAILTLKDNVLTANAGIDNKNAPPSFVVLWPLNPQEWVRRAREEIKRKTGKLVGVLIVDSGLMPLRIGTSGLALATAGFKPIRDVRGWKDIYGKPVIITRQAVADDLASATHLVMGEAAEKTPIVLVKDAPVDFDDVAHGSEEMMMPSKQCIFMGTFLSGRSDVIEKPSLKKLEP